MQTCETCGNAYERTFEIRMDGESHFFDSFECAIHKLAPRCAACHIPILGHGVEARDEIYCCSNCARRMGVSGITDHVV